MQKVLVKSLAPTPFDPTPPIINIIPIHTMSKYCYYSYSSSTGNFPHHSSTDHPHPHPDRDRHRHRDGDNVQGGRHQDFYDELAEFLTVVDRSDESFPSSITNMPPNSSSACVSAALGNDNMQLVNVGEWEARVAFRTKSENEIMDDGFKWRKYGKKMVKNSPYPRNYYKCSSEGCKVKKRVEKDREDPNYVITTYDGVHNHQSLFAICHDETTSPHNSSV
ncbi:probable WRKY transcription factor 51 isoform X2 [Diospyros lotus]|uniref:probable WRKY transcription factor 51 isoform X2 n=1 Tax=Diospyros lotus TaxID=55363 RepID=UPI00224D1D63|nr:probable WRKY transcription factor 51 isoform X2 [Diospyros lotus]